MLSKAPENAAQAAAIKTRHQKERKEKKKQSREKKKIKQKRKTLRSVANYPHRVKSSVAAIYVSANHSED